MKKTTIIFIIFFVLSLFVYNASAQSSEDEVYIVKKGDTLWSISYSKFDDYFLWPRLWNFNPHISNPDFIYPGTEINIPSKEKLMQVPFRPKTVKKPKRKHKPTVVFKSSKKAPLSHIINRELYIRSGWISDTYPSIGEIISSTSGRQSVVDGDIVYLRFKETKKPSKAVSTNASAVLVISKKKPDQQVRYFIIRKIKTVLHPETGKNLGNQIRIAGVLELAGKDNDIPKAIISESFEDIQIGDGLLPFKSMDPPFNPDLIRTPNIQGYVIESQMNSRILGMGDIIYLDKGEKDGLKIGDYFAAISETKIKRSIGIIQIISVQPKTSAAYIHESQTEIVVGSMWGKKN